MMSNISSYIIVGFMVALVSFVAANEIPSDGFDAAGTFEKIGDISADKRPNFFVGSRYGRSSSSPQLYESKTRRLNVAPRNDRFFLGSRYGKRASENIEEVYEQDSSNQSNIFTKVSCTYTGYKNFYRCNNLANDVNNYVENLKPDNYIQN